MQALRYYKEALQLIGDSNNFICEFVALLYFNIGCAYRESGSISEAFEYMKIVSTVINNIHLFVEINI